MYNFTNVIKGQRAVEKEKLLAGRIPVEKEKLIADEMKLPEIPLRKLGKFVEPAKQKDNRSKSSYELRLIGNALCRQLAIYENIQNGEIPLLPETKKALQTSIKELCKAIVEKLKD